MFFYSLNVNWKFVVCQKLLDTESMRSKNRHNSCSLGSHSLVGNATIQITSKYKITTNAVKGS